MESAVENAGELISSSLATPTATPFCAASSDPSAGCRLLKEGCPPSGGGLGGDCTPGCNSCAPDTDIYTLSLRTFAYGPLQFTIQIVLLQFRCRSTWARVKDRQ